LDAEDRTAASGLIQRLIDEPQLFSFFQMVQLVERQRKGAARVGHQGPASQECFRFRPVLSLAFPPGDVSTVEKVTDDYGTERFVVDTTFLGLYGSTSPLPSFYTEELLHESGDESLVRGFLDIFHHRLISLFYRCWEKYRYHVQFLRGGEDEFSRRMMCLLGLSVQGASWDDCVPKVRLLRYAGLLVGGSCPEEALKRVVSDYFDGIATGITPCIPRWVPIPPDIRNRLGGAHSVLGVDLHAGERIRDRAGKFRITMGPMGLQRFLAFLPHTDDFRALCEVVHVFVRDQLQFEVELVLRRTEIPDLNLAAGSPGAFLGQTTWLGRPAADAHVVLQEPRRASRLDSGGTDDGRAALAAA
jgi:type VI secretion system protein ImpH